MAAVHISFKYASTNFSELSLTEPLVQSSNHSVVKAEGFGGLRLEYLSVRKDVAIGARNQWSTG